ncbi:MAG: bifunctional nuclease family protein [Anaerolineae bacterium]|nr:bifunctional nuclease family protein [Anaerolineae bacterium]
MIEVTLEAIQMSLVSPHRIVVLREVDLERYLPIWIGPCEAEAIAVRMNDVAMPRPLTHDLLVNVLNALGVTLIYIYINALIDTTFYAQLVLDVNGKEMEIDSRPSDAIAIAVRAGVPIYIAEEVMEEAGVIPEQDLIITPVEGGEEEDKDLGVFRDFLSSLGEESTPPEETDES